MINLSVSWPDDNRRLFFALSYEMSSDANTQNGVVNDTILIDDIHIVRVNCLTNNIFKVD
jgi:hypothetical protein